MFSLFEKRTRVFLYTIIWVLYGVFHTISMYFIVRISAGLLMADALINTVLFAVSGVLLWHVLLYGNYKRLTPLQRGVNYLALAVLIISFCLGVSCLLDYLILKETAILLMPTLPIRILMGLLIYTIMILSFSSIQKQFLQTNKDADADFEINEKPVQLPTSTQQEIMERITIKTGQKLHIIPVEDIIYIQSDGDYVQLATKDGKFLKEQTMKFFETNLPEKLFVRTHRSYIVNIEYITRIESYGKQNQQIALKNGEWLKVSASGYRLLKEVLWL